MAMSQQGLVRASTARLQHTATGRGLTVRQRLRAFVTVGVALVIAVAGAGFVAVNYVENRTDEINELTNARYRMNEFGFAAVNLKESAGLAIFAADGSLDLSEEQLQQQFQVDLNLLQNALTDAQAADLPAEIHAQIKALTQPLATFLSETNRLISLPFTDLSAAAAALPAFQEKASAVMTERQAILDAIDVLVVKAQDRGSRVPGEIAKILLGLVIATVILLALSALIIGRSLRRSLQTLGDVARAIARGELHTRAAVTSEDELGELGCAINDMAVDLQNMVGQMEASAEREGFGAQLAEALEMADTEHEALGIIERAMTSISTTAPMEMMLADSSKAHLDRAAVNPASGAPCCPVESPFSCVAVRRGNPTVFTDSEALNGCPKLRGRPSGPISAVCVPVTFMGRAMGVLHTTGPVHQPPSADAVHHLTALATQAGARIGTVRSFERSQLQATTDGLTGLRNRRTIETELRALLNDAVQVTLVMADLDHFKLLNDTYGHETGDRALRMFSQVLESTLRETDLGGRFGGEEFVLAMPSTPVATAVQVLDRLRERLAVTATETGNPSFTASFGVVDSALGGTLEELLRLADVALYRAKAEGRNCVAVVDERDIANAAQQESRPTSAGSPARPTPAGALQRAAALDDPMPGIPEFR
jgi:diguanylate cyclase (GGDEF)-like protein